MSHFDSQACVSSRKREAINTLMAALAEGVWCYARRMPNRLWELLRKAKEAWSWAKFAWGVLALLGLSTSVVASVWAAVLRVPTPIVIMAGFCTFVAAVYLAMAPLAYKVLRQAASDTPTGRQSRKPESPNYTAVRLQHQYSLNAASRLWCDIDPNEQSTYDTAAWLEAMVSAVQRGELPFVVQDRDRATFEKAYPNNRTMVTRDALKKYAAKNGQSPKFLSDS
jgi:hypothetical protein